MIMSAFDQTVDRTGMDDVKSALAPAGLVQSGISTMWGAEFDFPTAPFIVKAVTDWAGKGLYAYTITSDDYRSCVADWMKTYRHWQVEKDWIVPTYGISASLAIAVRAFTHEGEGVIAFTPGYANYWRAIEKNGRRKVDCPMMFDGQSYSVDWDLLTKLTEAPSNTMLVLCNPQNPTGKVYSPEEIKKIGDLCRANDLVVFSDEIFAECMYDDRVITTFDQVCGDGLQVIAATSLGKWLSFTGTNHANMIISDPEARERFTAVRNAQFYGSMNPMMVPAVKAAYTQEGIAWRHDLMEYIKGNLNLVSSFFDRIPGFTVVKPQGTFILWVDGRRLAHCLADRTGQDPERVFMDFLLKKACFHVDEGSQYGAEKGFFRMNLAMPQRKLEENMQRLEAAVRNININ